MYPKVKDSNNKVRKLKWRCKKIDNLKTLMKHYKD